MVSLKAGTELTSMYAKMADNFTFLKQIINDYHTYYKLGEDEKVDFLGEMKNTYQVMLDNMVSFDINTLYANNGGDGWCIKEDEQWIFPMTYVK